MTQWNDVWLCKMAGWYAKPETIAPLQRYEITCRRLTARRLFWPCHITDPGFWETWVGDRLWPCHITDPGFWETWVVDLLWPILTLSCRAGRKLFREYESPRALVIFRYFVSDSRRCATVENWCRCTPVSQWKMVVHYQVLASMTSSAQDLFTG